MSEKHPSQPEPPGDQILRDLSSADSERARQAWSQLIHAYEVYLVDRLRRKFTCRKAEARDWVRAFFSDGFCRGSLSRNLPRVPSTKLVAYIRKALWNYVIRQSLIIERQGQLLVDELTYLDHSPERTADDGDSRIVKILKSVLQGIAHDSYRKQRQAQWSVFHSRQLAPLVFRLPRASYQQLASYLGLKSAKEAETMFAVTMRELRKRLELEGIQRDAVRGLMHAIENQDRLRRAMAQVAPACGSTSERTARSIISHDFIHPEDGVEFSALKDALTSELSKSLADLRILNISDSYAATTLEELFVSSDMPHLETFRKLKQHFKRVFQDTRSTDTTRSSAAIVLYTAVIAKGMMAHGVVIPTRLPSVLAEQIRRWIPMPWMPNSLRDLFKTLLPVLLSR